MPVYENPKKGLEFECNFCQKKLRLDFQGRSRETVEDRATEELGWTILGPDTCFCPDHRPGSLQDIVVIAEFASTTSQASGFNIHYHRFKSEADKNLVLSGRPVSHLTRGTVLIHGEMLPPDDTLPAPDAPHPLGHALPSTLDKALTAATAALANPNSRIRSQGFHPMTPIYLWVPGRVCVFYLGDFHATARWG